MKFVNLPELTPVTPTDISLKKKIVIALEIPLKESQFLDKSNYLDEFATEEEKEKARNNLGIGSVINDNTFKGLVTDITVGGLVANTNVSGLTVKQVLTSILTAEYAPVWHNSSYGISVGNYYNNQYLAVGTEILGPDSITETSDPAKATIGDVVIVLTGPIINLKTISISKTGEKYILPKGTVTYLLQYKYGESDDAVVSSKGNLTNKTADLSNVLLNTITTVNSKIDSNTYHIKADDSYTTNTINIIGCYSMYGNTESDDLKNVGLSKAYSSGLELTFSNTDTKKRIPYLLIPTDNKISSFTIYSLASGKYESSSYDFIKSENTEKNPDGIDCYKYIYSDPNTAESFKFKFIIE